MHFHGKAKIVSRKRRPLAATARSLPGDLQVLGCPCRRQRHGEYWYQVAFKVGDGALVQSTQRPSSPCPVVLRLAEQRFHIARI